MSHWKLGESTGTTASDRKAARNGTYAGAPTLNHGVLVSGNLGDPAVGFDGVTDRVDTTRDPILDFAGTTAFSVEAWVKITSWDTNARYICGQQDATDGWALLAINTVTHPQAIRFERRIGGVARMAESTGLFRHAIYHVVGVYTGTDVRIYIDGNETIGEADTRTMPTQTGFFCIADRSA